MESLALKRLSLRTHRSDHGQACHERVKGQTF